MGVARKVGQGRIRDWNRIAAKLVGRTNKDCRKRWGKVCQQLKKGAWCDSEDERLLSAVGRFGYRLVFLLGPFAFSLEEVKYNPGLGRAEVSL